MSKKKLSRVFDNGKINMIQNVNQILNPILYCKGVYNAIYDVKIDTVYKHHNPNLLGAKQGLLYV